jgi:tryptophan-rich sensory protein
MKIKNISTYIASIVICQMAGIIGSVFTASSVKSWYTTIEKSPLNPPSWAFAPVWTALFILMGVSLAMIWKSEKNALRSKALKVFSLQLILNTLWSIIFFGLKNPPLAFFEIIILWFSILFTILLFRKIKRIAACLLIPYILWVSFASYLNLSVALLN